MPCCELSGTSYAWHLFIFHPAKNSRLITFNLSLLEKKSQDGFQTVCRPVPTTVQLVYRSLKQKSNLMTFKFLSVKT